jgi:hypothetical protein
MLASRSTCSTILAICVGAIPAAASARGMTPVTIFAESAPSMKLIMVALLAAAIAAVVVTVRKVASGRHLSGGSAYVSALRLGAPLLGLLGAAYNGLLGFMAIARFGAPSIQVLAPGLAEAFFLLVLGLAVGVVGVICHWIVEARVDRAVLSA